MYETKFPNGKTGQEIQDEIFRKMSADEKLKVGADLWRLAREIAPEKVRYGADRPKTSSR
ncbi:MAG: hypothetical protein HYV77_00390 [Candidatus Wildermuthbacteria bacterium]|nr:hypothetical protein [Candidatus Wildermuthbacteria bacterium]